MKYIPLFGEEAKSRTHVGNHWCKKYVRAIQSILNVTKGIVAPGRSFFEKAFGKNLEEYFEILHMPEAFIIYMYLYEELGHTGRWREAFNALSPEEKAQALEIIKKSEFSNIESLTTNPKILYLLTFYTIKREDLQNKDKVFEKTKQQFQKLIKEDKFKNLTVTYDYEMPLSQNSIY